LCGREWRDYNANRRRKSTVVELRLDPAGGLHSKMPASLRSAPSMTARNTAILAVIVGMTSLHAAAISKQQADLFTRKVAQIVVQGDGPAPANAAAGSRRTQ